MGLLPQDHGRSPAAARQSICQHRWKAPSRPDQNAERGPGAHRPRLGLGVEQQRLWRHVGARHQQMHGVLSTSACQGCSILDVAPQEAKGRHRAPLHRRSGGRCCLLAWGRGEARRREAEPAAGRQHTWCMNPKKMQPAALKATHNATRCLLPRRRPPERTPSGSSSGRRNRGSWCGARESPASGSSATDHSNASTTRPAGSSASPRLARASVGSGLPLEDADGAARSHPAASHHRITYAQREKFNRGRSVSRA